MAKAYKGMCEITLGQTGGILTAYGPTIGVNCIFFGGKITHKNGAFSGLQWPQNVILIVGAFLRTKIAPRCIKKKKRDYISNLPSPKTYCLYISIENVYD